MTFSELLGLVSIGLAIASVVLTMLHQQYVRGKAKELAAEIQIELPVPVDQIELLTREFLLQRLRNEIDPVILDRLLIELQRISVDIRTANLAHPNIRVRAG